MPIYCYKCEPCNRTTEEFVQRMEPPVVKCWECGEPMDRDITAEHVHADLDYQNPIYSEALGINPSQIEAARKQFPEDQYTPDGRMILTSHRQRDKVLKRLGFHDRT